MTNSNSHSIRLLLLRSWTLIIPNVSLVYANALAHLSGVNGASFVGVRVGSLGKFLYLALFCSLYPILNPSCSILRLNNHLAVLNHKVTIERIDKAGTV